MLPILAGWINWLWWLAMLALYDGYDFSLSWTSSLGCYTGWYAGYISWLFCNILLVILVGCAV